MSYLADGINRGASIGAEAYLALKKRQQDELDRKQRLEESMAERGLRMQLAANSIKAERDALERRLGADAENLRFNRDWQSSEADKDRTFRGSESAADRAARKTMFDQNRADEFSDANPKNQVFQAQIARLNADANKEQAQAAYLNQKAKAGMVPESPSPYDAEVQKLESDIAQNRIAMADGDNRSGFLNLKSRQGSIDEAQKKLLRLRAMAIQDRLERGEISQEQADAMAAKLLPQ